MSVLDIVTIPHPALKTKAAPIRAVNSKIARLINDMTETMRRFPRCVGLAAPQTGSSLRLIVVDVSLHPRPHTNHGLLVLMNPVILSAEGKRTGREGCLSVPEYTGTVTRAEKIVIEGMNADGRNQRFETTGFEAVVLQHEIDHLNGILFLDRVVSLKTDVFRRKDFHE